MIPGASGCCWRQSAAPTPAVATTDQTVDSSLSEASRNDESDRVIVASSDVLEAMPEAMQKRRLPRLSPSAVGDESPRR